MTKQNFINPEKVLLEAGLRPEMQVVDLGAGNGFFTMPAAAIVGDQGQVIAVDILEESLSKIMSQARLNRHKNIRTLHFDLEDQAGSEVRPLSCDFVLVGKVLQQLSKAENLVKEAYRILKTGGIAVIIEWKKEHMAFGPAYELRLAQEDAKGMFIKKGFKFLREFEPDKYHYVLLLQK